MKVDYSEAFRYMGVKGTPDPATAALAREAEGEVQKYAKLRSIYRLFDIQVDEEEGFVLLKEAGVKLEGKHLSRHLRDCKRAYLIAATLGFDMERRVNYLMQTRPALGVATDAMCTSALECGLDELCERLEGECGSKLKTRFSCGYGDFPLSAQKDMVNLLDTGRKIGVFLSESMMLAPQKSVTAVAGITDRAEQIKGGCENCAKGDCAFRKENK